jgi:HEPN domain-containing protein
LTLENIEFFKSHDLDYLLKLSKDCDSKFTDYEEAVLVLNKYGIEPRYPADIPVFYSVEETKKAIKLAKELMSFMGKKI